jgi:hypothetical protein
VLPQTRTLVLICWPALMLCCVMHLLVFVRNKVVDSVGKNDGCLRRPPRVGNVSWICSFNLSQSCVLGFRNSKVAGLTQNRFVVLRRMQRSGFSVLSLSLQTIKKVVFRYIWVKHVCFNYRTYQTVMVERRRINYHNLIGYSCQNNHNLSTKSTATTSTTGCGETI